MTRKPGKGVKDVSGQALLRAESSSRSGKPVLDDNPDWYSAPEAGLTRTDDKRRTIEERERKMFDLARSHILSSGDFLLAQDLADHLGIHVQLMGAALKEWEADRRIFSIEHGDFKSFPVYAFPAEGGASPIPALKDILSILYPMKNGWGVSFWFISPNAFLGGKRPQDLLSTEVNSVILAARDETVGVTHG